MKKRKKRNNNKKNTRKYIRNINNRKNSIKRKAHQVDKESLPVRLRKKKRFSTNAAAPIKMRLKRKKKSHH